MESLSSAFNPVQLFVFVVPTVSLAIGTVSLAIHPRLAMLAFPIVMGWTYLASPWGHSLVGALVPLVKVAELRAKGISAMAAYTIAGGTASLLVGAALGTAGGILLAGSAGERYGLVVAILVAAAAVVHEMGWATLPVPQVNRQTNVIWARRLGTRTAAAMWGFDLGLIFTTRMTFSGTWSILALAASSRQASLGGLFLLLYWLGRSANVWIAPMLVLEANDVPRLLRGVHQKYSALQRMHVVALVWAIAVLGFFVHAGNPL